MPNSSSPKPLSEVSLDELKAKEKLLNAIIYLAAFFIVVNIGYVIFRLVTHKIDSVSELTGQTFFSMGGFGASLLLCSYLLKKVKAEMSAREHRGAAK